MTSQQPQSTGPGNDLIEIARPYPTDLVERKNGSDYVAHHIANQRLLSVVGPFDFELVQVIRGDVEAAAPDPNARSARGKTGTPALKNIVVGGIWRLTVVIDGRPARIEEVGDVGDVHNWAHDGARLKDAASDALKRCSMRLGLGLHLWAQEHYFLDQQLQAQARAANGHQPTTAQEEPPPAGVNTTTGEITGEAPEGALADVKDIGHHLAITRPANDPPRTQAKPTPTPQPAAPAGAAAASKGPEGETPQAAEKRLEIKGKAIKLLRGTTDKPGPFPGLLSLDTLAPDEHADAIAFLEVEAAKIHARTG